MTNQANRANQTYQEWLNKPYFANAFDELKALDDQQIAERFSGDLQFGTAGIRGIMAAGTNRINIYIIRRVTAALAKYLWQANPNLKQPVIIAYDSRNFSEQFAKETASVLAIMGIKTYIFNNITPVPALSFAVRQLKAAAGVVITASHNPKQYNGYKVYGSDGAQIGPQAAAQIQDIIADLAWPIVPMAYQDALEQGLITIIGDDIYDLYLAQVSKQLLNRDLCANHGSKLAIVYSPLHGAGLELCRKVLLSSGFSDLHIVEEQANPDGNFPTVASPNPEDRSAMDLAIKQAISLNAPLVLATDPDADRLGVCLRQADGSYYQFSGNQIGLVLAYYLINCLKQNNAFNGDLTIVKSIVSSSLADKMIKAMGAKITNVPVGFKFIGEQINLLKDNFLFGFEESMGYLKGAYARDKDAILACALVAEAALYYQHYQQKSLLDVLIEIYDQYGYFIDYQQAYSFDGLKGQAIMADLMLAIKSDKRQIIGGKTVLSREDYGLAQQQVADQIRPLAFPQMDLLGLTFSDGSSIKARPSGTEPKIRFYFSISGANQAMAEQYLAEVKAEYLAAFSQFLS